MELTRITKVLLWLLSKRPDIGNLTVQDTETTDSLLDLEAFTNDELYEFPDDHELYLQFDREHLEECLNRQPDDRKTA